MHNVSRRGFFGTTAAAAIGLSAPTVFTRRARGAVTLTPRKLLIPLVDQLGAYEPTLSADGNTMYFARFANNGDKTVNGPTDIFVSHRIRQTGEWPGPAEDWTPAVRLSDAVNSSAVDQEPWITADGNTLYFMSERKAPDVGPTSVWETHKLPNGEWGQATPIAPGNVNLPGYVSHCFLPIELPGEPVRFNFISIRPRAAGESPSADIYTTHQVDGAWQTAQRYDDRLLDSIANKCRFNVVTRDGFTLGVVSVHDFAKFHTLLFVHYDPQSRQWKGPIVEAPFNNWAIDGACTHFQHNGERMVWAAGYDHGPDIISGQNDGSGGLYDLYWLPTSEVVAYYRSRAGIG